MEHFIDAYKHYADFSGRANREKYWMFYLFYMLAYIILAIMDEIAGTGGVLSGIFTLGSLIPSIAIAARRLHDINRSGWWQLLILIPIVGAIVLLIFYVTKGDEGENRFGTDPLRAV